MRIKKLHSFEKLTALAETKLDTLKVTAQTLVDDDHYASDEIRDIMESLQTRYVRYSGCAVDYPSFLGEL